jgi:hypothetical protein
MAWPNVADGLWQPVGALRGGDDAASGALTRPQKSPTEGVKLRTQLPFLKLRTPALAGKKRRPGATGPSSLERQLFHWRRSHGRGDYGGVSSGN